MTRAQWLTLAELAQRLPPGHGDSAEMLAQYDAALEGEEFSFVVGRDELPRQAWRMVNRPGPQGRPRRPRRP